MTDGAGAAAGAAHVTRVQKKPERKVWEMR
jgi:hypothetical protein